MRHQTHPLLALLLMASAATGQRQDLRIAFVSPKSGQGATAFEAKLDKIAPHSLRLGCDELSMEAIWNVDVAVIDWPADVELPAAFVAAFERWPHATLFTATCAPRWAKALNLPSPRELAAMPKTDRDPSVQQADLGGRSAWRHGNLLYLPELAFESHQASKQLAEALSLVVRYSVDRPVLRAADPAKADRMHKTANELGVDPASMISIAERAKQLGTANDGKALALFAHLLPDGPADQATAKAWQRWLRNHESYLLFDAGSNVWRLDPLAEKLRKPAGSLREADRATPGTSNPAGLQLAERIVARYGGDALRDLRTFSCWIGERHVMWDRQLGYLRIDNHHQIPPGNRATPWKALVHDTHQDKETIWGGGPPPRPRVSGRSTMWQISQLVFLPLQLRQPNTSVRLIASESNDCSARLEVRTCATYADVRARIVLEVERKTAAVLALELYAGNRLRKRWHLADTTPCGPLQLPTRWRDIRSLRGRGFVIESPIWNPTLPKGLTTSPEQITQPRSK